MAGYTEGRFGKGGIAGIKLDTRRILGYMGGGGRGSVRKKEKKEKKKVIHSNNAFLRKFPGIGVYVANM